MNSKIIYCEKTKYIIGTTTLWLLLPIYYGIFNFFNKYDKNALYILILSSVMSISCFVSTKMWKNRNKTFFLYYLDIILANVLFILLIIITVYIKYNSISLYKKILFPSIIILFYSITTYFYIKKYINLSAIFHILFRYVGCIWCCILIGYPNIYIYIYILPLSLIYFGYIIYEWNNINYINNKCTYKFTCNKYYNNGCINLIKLIFLILILTNIYEYYNI